MAYKDQETARAAARRFREANPGYGRAQYAKHADKRRAAKVDAYHADPDASRASQRERYARNAETVRKQQADYRGRNRAALVQQQRAWREANPEKEELHRAKRALMIQTGVRMRDIPADLAEAKAIAISIAREIENLRKSSSLHVQPKGPPMNCFERGYRAALSDVTKLAKLYGEENMTICGDNILMDPLLHGKEWTPENVKKSEDCGVLSTIHSAQYHASEHLVAAIAAMPRRAS